MLEKKEDWLTDAAKILIKLFIVILCNTLTMITIMMMIMMIINDQDENEERKAIKLKRSVFE